MKHTLFSACVWLLLGTAVGAQPPARFGYNPYIGTPTPPSSFANPAYNPMTGLGYAGGGYYNSWTNSRLGNSAMYNPYTGGLITPGAAYNPWSGYARDRTFDPLYYGRY